MKKWISYFAVATLSSPAVSAAGSQPFTGFSGGINAGVVNAETKITQWSGYNKGDSDPIDWSTGSPVKISDLSGIVGLHLGYANCFNPCITWGVELRASYLNINTGLHDIYSILTGDEEQQVSQSISVKLNQQYAAIAKIGYLFKCDTQLYAFIGPQLGHFKLNATSVYSELEPPAIPPDDSYAAIASDKTDNRIGWHWGLGLERQLTPCMSIGVEYNYADYGHLDFDKVLHTQFIGNPNIVVNSFLDRYQNAHVITNTMIVRFNYYYG